MSGFYADDPPWAYRPPETQFAQPQSAQRMTQSPQDQVLSYGQGPVSKDYALEQGMAGAGGMAMGSSMLMANAGMAAAGPIGWAGLGLTAVGTGMGLFGDDGEEERKKAQKEAERKQQIQKLRGGMRRLSQYLESSRISKGAQYANALGGSNTQGAFY